MKAVGFRGRSLLFLPAFFLFSCGTDQVSRKVGPETPLAQVRRLEAPFQAGIQLLASRVQVELSRNYSQDPTLCLPAGGGDLHPVVKRPSGFDWRAKAGPGWIPLEFRFRRLKAKVLDRLIVDFPPVTRFTASLKAWGHVVLVLPGGETLRGERLVVEGGRVVLDGKEVPFRASPGSRAGAPASPPSGKGNGL